MILVDTSIWVDHLRKGDPQLRLLLNSNQVLMHPFVRGELACGDLRNRSEILTLLQDLPRAAVATEDEVLVLIERHGLMSCGIGYIDAHLLAAVLLEGSAKLWSRDKRLLGVAESMGLAYRPT